MSQLFVVTYAALGGSCTAEAVCTLGTFRPELPKVLCTKEAAKNANKHVNNNKAILLRGQNEGCCHGGCASLLIGMGKNAGPSGYKYIIQGAQRDLTNLIAPISCVFLMAP